MLNKNNFFKNFSFNSKKFSSSLKKTKKVFKDFKIDLNNQQIPLLQSYENEYDFDFSSNTIKKFSKYKTIVVIGMGGSILGAKSIYSFFKKKIKKKVFFFDDLDENQHLKFKNLKNYCVVVISKSGNTLETITNFELIFSKHLKKNKLIFITEIKDNVLMSLAKKLNAEIIEHKDFIGGRYSVLSEVGMFPAALMGLDIKKFKGLQILIKDKNFVSSLIHNVASIYTFMNQGKNNSVILNYDSDLIELSNWYQQLTSESLGKNGKGITTIMTSVPNGNHSVLQLYLDGPKDKFFTFFNSSNKFTKNKISNKIITENMKFLKNKNLRSIITSQCNATKNIFKLKNIPFRYFSFNKNNEFELGKIFTFFVLETILLARLMNVNAFDQPAVEQVKIETKNIMSK